MITFEEASNLLDYDPNLGLLTWREKPSKRVLLSAKVGHLEKHGYMTVKLHGRKYGYHRIAWLLFYREWPKNQIDHKDQDPTNNRISNLREANSAQNLQNRKTPKNNTTGVKGCSWSPAYGQFRVRFQKDGKSIHVGYFNSIEEANIAAKIARSKHFGEFANHG